MRYGIDKTFGGILSDATMKSRGIELANEVIRNFYRPEKNAILEFVALDGHLIDSPQGRACVPGHAVESLWFLISIFERSGNIGAIPLCCQLIERHLHLAWDHERGGLILALDIDGRSPVYWQHARCKPWWVQVEALVATAYACRHCREPWCLSWHQKIQEFAFGNYPVATGEWSAWLDENGSRMKNPVIPVKDPFHLPRGLMELIEVFSC